MLRAVLLGVLVVSVSACSKSATETSAKVAPGAAAGKVLEVKGSVTVKHGDAAKPLAVGETVEGDDTVITGADGNVVIELAHNSARWELGPNKQQRVRESIAWKAEKATAQEIDQATAAAGRPAERNAAGTVATAEEPAAAAEEAPAPEAAMAPPAKSAAPAEPDMMPKGGGESEKAERPARRRVASAPKAAAAPAPKPPPPPPDDLSDDEGMTTPRTTRGAKAKAASPQVESAAAPGGGVAVGGATRGGGTASIGASAPSSTSTAPNPLAAKSIALHKCVVDHGSNEEVTVVVEVVNGKPTVKLTSKAAISAALDKCLKGVVSTISFTGSSKISRVVKP